MTRKKWTSYKLKTITLSDKVAQDIIPIGNFGQSMKGNFI